MTLNTCRKRESLANKLHKKEGQQVYRMPYNRQHYKSMANILDTTHQHHRHKSNTTMGIAKDIGKRNNSIKEAMRHKLQTQTPTPNHTTTQLVTKTNRAQ
jgi:hypothetical protein